MRNLTVKRRKSFVGCIMSLKVYIEDREASDLTICDIPCRKLGELRNGEEKTFSVENGAAHVFVIVDPMSKDYCNDLYLLSEGEEDVSISGVCKFNLGNGNAFRFDGAPSEEALANRKKHGKKGAALMTAAIVVGVIIGLVFVFVVFPALNKPRPKTFSSSEMSISLNDSFKEDTDENFNMSVYSKSVVVFAVRDAFADFDGIDALSVDEYANLIASSRDFENMTELTHENGLTYFTYEFTNPENSTTWSYFLSFYKSDDAFWIVQFVAKKEAFEKYRPDIVKWAQSVTFK